MEHVNFRSRLDETYLAPGLVGLNVLWRILWLPFSQGAYTDGILQIDFFGWGLTYWPPLYALLARLFVWVPGLGLEGSGRLISIVFSSLAVLPVGYLARYLFGRRAALMAMLVYTVSPLALRWGLQVMTDATFMSLWIFAVAALLAASRRLWPDLFDQGDGRSPLKPRDGAQWLLLASLLGTLATLTRYQGIILFPLFAFVTWRATRIESEELASARLRIGLSTLPWLLVPVWLLRNGFDAIMVHYEQIGQRSASGSPVQTLLNYWYYFEEFVLTSPYTFTYGIFGFFLYGLFRLQFRTTRLRNSVWAALYLALAVLVLQSIFQAFQSRYLLPLLPFMCLGAGHGMAVWERRCENKRNRFWALAVPTLVYAVLFSSLVAFYQGDPFIDVKKAGKYLQSVSPEARIFTNEVYNEKIGAPKVAFWSGRRDIHYFGGSTRPVAGDFIVLSSFYGGLGRGGWTSYRQLKQEAMDIFFAVEVEVYGNAIYPLMDDIMQEPMTHVNPLARHLRYFRQDFETSILLVRAADDAGQPSAPSMDLTPNGPARPASSETRDAMGEAVEGAMQDATGGQPGVWPSDEELLESEPQTPQDNP